MAEQKIEESSRRIESIVPNLRQSLGIAAM